MSKGSETSIQRTSGGSSFGRVTVTWLPSGSLLSFRLSWRTYCVVGESSASPSSSSSPMSSIRETFAPPLVKSCGVRRSRSPSNCGERCVIEATNNMDLEPRTLICRWTRVLMSVEQYWKSLSG
jgi:hypothetical protein